MKKIFDNSIDWENSIKESLASYSFQKELTVKLDNISEDFTDQTLLEIVLWKTNRYPIFSDEIIKQINNLKSDFSIQKAKAVLRTLLKLKGFNLPMASTVLKFACPNKLQIIDQRVYRFIMPENNFLKIPYNIDKKITLYFDYIETLKSLCTKYNIPFNKSDRILYQLDKTLNSEIPIKY